MLENIKKLILERKAYREAADLIMESDELDDSIILISEGPDEIEDVKDEEDEKEPTSVDDEKEDDEKDDEEEDEDEDKDEDDDREKGDFLDQPAEEPDEQPMSLPGEDNLPEPIGRQTGEPAIIGDGDILDVTINLATNTQSDTLPIPPANAGDAISSDDDDIMNQKIDSGFGGEDADTTTSPIDPTAQEATDDILDTPVSEGSSYDDDHVENDMDYDDDEFPKKKKGECKGGQCKECKESYDDLLSEAITLGGDDASDAPADAGTGDIADEPIIDEAPDKDNVVTAAVKDKVSELKSEDEVLPPDDGSTGSGDDGGDGNLQDPKSVLQRLSKLTKGIEDIKNGIISSLKK